MLFVGSLLPVQNFSLHICSNNQRKVVSLHEIRLKNFNTYNDYGK